MRLGGTYKFKRNVICWLIVLSLLFIAMLKRNNYTELHRRVKQLELIHKREEGASDTQAEFERSGF